MRVKIFYSESIHELEKMVNAGAEELEKQNCYITDITIRAERLTYDLFIGIINYRLPAKEEIVGNFFPSESCLD